jgi:MFS family permease
MLWGGVLMCHAACHTFAGLATVRILLGMLEGFCNPATMILFGMYYRRDEQPFRMGLWISFGGVSYALSGIMAYGIGFIHGSLAPWRVLYLVRFFFSSASALR